jgi:hypothetical protein
MHDPKHNNLIDLEAKARDIRASLRERAPIDFYNVHRLPEHVTDTARYAAYYDRAAWAYAVAQAARWNAGIPARRAAAERAEAKARALMDELPGWVRNFHDKTVGGLL